MTLTGENANLPEVCHGIRQFPTPCSIALTIWDVTRWYTSCLGVMVLSCVDIEAPLKLWCSGATSSANLARSRFASANSSQIHDNYTI
jgi:hypothetical protein